MVFVPPKDRVLEHSTSNSQTVFAVTGALDTSYNAFSASMSVADTTVGAVVEAGVAFKSGVLTYSATNQVTVTTVKESKGTFSSGGVKEVFMGEPAVSALIVDGPQTLTAAQKAQVSSNIFKGPTTQPFTSGSGTYTTPANVLWLEVYVCGGGGGGGGASTSSGVVGTAGGTSTFNGINAAGGGGALNGGVSSGLGGAGGSGAATRRYPGSPGGGGANIVPGTPVSSGNGGASGLLGGGGASLTGGSISAGNAGQTNSGSGGSGAAYNGTNYFSAAGGGGGEGFYLIINNPSATYTYTVGGGGAGGVGTTTGGAGAAGFIQVIERYS